jgi:hypothetical protein
LILDAGATPDVFAESETPEADTEVVEETIVVQGTTREDVLTQVPSTVAPVVTEETLDGGQKVS